MTFDGAVLTVLCMVALAAYVVRGVTGAASAIVVNGALLVLITTEVFPREMLRDGLYWLALADLTAGLAMALRLRHELVWEPLTAKMLSGYLPISALFTVLLVSVSLAILEAALAVALVIVGLFSVARPRPEPVSDELVRKLALPVGAAAGVLGGLFGMGGPVAMLLLQRAGGGSATFRRRATFIMTSNNVLRVIILGGLGAFSASHFAWLLITMPFIAAGLFVGFWIHTRLDARLFRSLIAVLVMLAGVVALGRLLAAAN